MTARLLIEATGPLASVQDRGRPGWRRYGVPPSGPVDRRAFAAALAAVGLPEEAAALELSLGGLTLRCEDAPVSIAVTGGARATIDGAAVGGWSVARLAPGARCRVTMAGNWGYLAVAGAIDRPAWLGSRSTHLIAGLGGGRLVAGETLTVINPRDDIAAAEIPAPDVGPIRAARIVLGPQERFFEAAMLARLTATDFMATARFDRMGMALDGPPLSPMRVDMPSEPALRGALQVDGEGRLTMLTADHQTTGGYPRIAVMIDPDIDLVAQLPAGAPVRFVAVDAAEAVALTRKARIADARWLAEVAAQRVLRPSLLQANLIGGVVDALDPEAPGSG